MPNHVHIVFTPIVSRTGCSTYIVTDILKSLKWYTALRCNKLLKHSGAFWQHESYDHVVQDEKELRRIVEYILNNPVKAGLCEKWEDWQWSYYNFNLIG
jgi:REP element-mobilizing transposase RayT